MTDEYEYETPCGFEEMRECGTREDQEFYSMLRKMVQKYCPVLDMQFRTEMDDDAQCLHLQLNGKKDDDMIVDEYKNFVYASFFPHILEITDICYFPTRTLINDVVDESCTLERKTSLIVSNYDSRLLWSIILGQLGLIDYLEPEGKQNADV